MLFLIILGKTGTIAVLFMLVGLVLMLIPPMCSRVRLVSAWTGAVLWVGGVVLIIVRAF